MSLEGILERRWWTAEHRAPDERRNIARRVGLGKYCDGDELSLEGVQERIAGIPPDAVRGSNFFHRACKNERVTLEIIECLLRAFPDAAGSSDGYGQSPLHYACVNKSMDPRIVRVLLDSWPESSNHRDNNGGLPLHALCCSRSVDERALLAVLDLLLAADPLSATAVDGAGSLPIHTAIWKGKPHPFCKRLIDAHPESLRVQSRRGWLPIHDACYYGDVKTVKYMLELDPESINARGDMELPIHFAARSGCNGQDNVATIQYLLAKDPACVLKTGRSGFLPLHIACGNARVCLESVRLLFDAYPEAISIQIVGGNTPLDIARKYERSAVVEFLEGQLPYVQQAEDGRARWLPLHHALKNGASLGSIKLLCRANRDALHVSNDQSVFPLHIACGFSSVDVVEHILGLSDNHLHALDLQSNSTLHYACRGDNVGVVKCLLDRGVPSVSEPNSDGKLPIHLLWESDVDRDSVEYVDAVWRLLLARPETVTP